MSPENGADDHHPAVKVGPKIDSNKGPATGSLADTVAAPADQGPNASPTSARARRRIDPEIQNPSSTPPRIEPM